MNTSSITISKPIETLNAICRPEIYQKLQMQQHNDLKWKDTEQLESD